MPHMKKSEVTSGSKYKMKPKRPEQPYKKIVAMTAREGQNKREIIERRFCDLVGHNQVPKTSPAHNTTFALQCEEVG